MQEITGGHRYMGKVKITAEVVSQTCIATDIYSLILKAGEIVSQAVAGQFVSVYSKDGSRQDRSVYVELIKKQVRFVWYIVSLEREQMSSQNYRQEIRLIFLVRLEMAL